MSTPFEHLTLFTEQHHKDQRQKFWENHGVNAEFFRTSCGRKEAPASGWCRDWSEKPWRGPAYLRKKLERSGTPQSWAVRNGVEFQEVLFGVKVLWSTPENNSTLRALTVPTVNHGGGSIELWYTSSSSGFRCWWKRLSLCSLMVPLDHTKDTKSVSLTVSLSAPFPCFFFFFIFYPTFPSQPPFALMNRSSMPTHTVPVCLRPDLCPVLRGQIIWNN